MRGQFILVLLVAGPVLGVEPEKQYVIFPVRTELQRELFSPTHRFHIVLNGDAIFDKEGRLDPAAVPVDAILKDISVSLRPKDSLSVGTEFFKLFPPDNSRRLLEVAMMGMGQEEGFATNYYNSINASDSWKAILALTKGARGRIDENEEEDAVENETVRAYTIQTVFSRWRLGDANCYVRFKAPIGKDFDGAITPKMEKDVKAALEKLGLKEKKSAYFAIRYEDKSDVSLTRRFTDKAGPDLAKAMGFKGCSVSTGRFSLKSDPQGK